MLLVKFYKLVWVLSYKVLINYLNFWKWKWVIHLKLHLPPKSKTKFDSHLRGKEHSHETPIRSIHFFNSLLLLSINYLNRSHYQRLLVNLCLQKNSKYIAMDDGAWVRASWGELKEKMKDNLLAGVDLFLCVKAKESIHLLLLSYIF
jgi:hypothetical protein